MSPGEDEGLHAADLPWSSVDHQAAGKAREKG